LAALPLFADPPQPVVVDAVTDRYRPLLFDQQKLAGLLARRMRANSEGYLEHVDDQLSGSQSGLSNSAAGGLGEQAGKFLEASANAYEYRHDDHLRAVMDRVAKQLIAVHTAGRHLAEHSTDERGDSQDLLIQKYDVLGLLAYYRVTDDENALTAARKIGDLLVKIFPKGAADPSQYRRITALIEPLVALYRYTEENRYLDASRSAADAWLQWKERHSEPTFENLSNLQGLVELYRVTGDESYFRSVPTSWIEVRTRSLSIAGNPLSNRQRAAADESKNGGDACATLAWIQLTVNLLRVTGDVRYAEQLERTIYNQLFAAQDPNTGAILSPAPLNGSKQSASNSDACASSEAQGVALVPSAVWGRYGNGIAVLLYNAGRGTFQLRRRGTVQLYSEATFPETGDFLLHVEPAHNMRFPLRLRVPEWTNNFVVDFGGSHLVGKPGDFLTINREWKPGDTIKISIDMTARVVSGSPEYPDQIAVERGPQVLALPRSLNPQLTDLKDVAILAEDSSRPKLVPVTGRLPSNWFGDQAYTISGEYQGKSQQLVLAPFADAKTYRVWLKKASASSGATN
jgi:DUF1680 family protein